MTTLLYLFLTLSLMDHPLASLFTVAVVAVFCVLLVIDTMLLRRIRQRSQVTKERGLMMQQALKISANNVVRYDVRDRFIHQLYGHLFPESGISQDEWLEHVHPDDKDEVVSRIHKLIEGEVSRDEFYYRWNYDYSGGRPRWGYIHNVSVVEYLPGYKRPSNIISTLRDETELRSQEQEEGDLTDRYRLIFENSIIGLSFYSPDGWLLDSNKIMRRICHFDSDEGDGFFSTTNLFDMSPFRECCDRNNLTELWICSQSIVPERNIYDYLEIRLFPIYDDVGRLSYISVAARNVTEEREMYLQAKRNDLQLQDVNKQIQRYEQELRYMMKSIDMQTWRISLDRQCIEFYSGLRDVARTFSLDQLPQIFVNQDDDFVKALYQPATAIDHPLFYVGQLYPMVTQQHEGPQWVQINSIPEYDDKGRLLGSFGVWRNISNLMEKQDQLKRETERANDSGRLKSVFLANMTHEIRTPLNAIVGFSDLLQAIEAPDDKREMIRVIHNNCDMLLRLMNDMLVLSNVDANAMQIIVSNVDFAKTFDEVCESLEQRVQNPAVTFVKNNPYTKLTTRMDHGRIEQVITNFVTNAVKYTQQGHIRVGYRVEKRTTKSGRLSDGLYCYCEDTGTGIPADQFDRVFERFVKLNDYIQGTGLGLSICKAIIEKCDGEIGLESEVDKGSTFWFWIPVVIQQIEAK